jgi:hypothetical protein
MSKAMFYLSATPSSSNILVSRRLLVPLRLTRRRLRLTLQLLALQTDFLVDSGATHHVTSDLANLAALHHPYTGPDSLFMGNGSGLNITHSGTLLHNDLSLSNALCVPSMKQKIISVSKLTKQTNSAVVFLPHSFHVKDLMTGQTTHRGSCVDGLYLWPATPPSAQNPLLHGTIGLGTLHLLSSNLFNNTFLWGQINFSNQIATPVKLAKVINFLLVNPPSHLLIHWK